jgi:hypothetical protein
MKDRSYILLVTGALLAAPLSSRGQGLPSQLPNPPVASKNKEDKTGEKYKDIHGNEVTQVKVGEEFKVKNIYGRKVTASIVKDSSGRHAIRSVFERALASEPRYYLIDGIVSFANTSDRTITIYFKDQPDLKWKGAVDVINGNGDAVKVQNLETVDFVW